MIIIVDTDDKICQCNLIFNIYLYFFELKTHKCGISINQYNNWVAKKCILQIMKSLSTQWGDVWWCAAAGDGGEGIVVVVF